MMRQLIAIRIMRCMKRKQTLPQLLQLVLLQPLNQLNQLSRGKRSIICMYKVVVKKAMGKKFKVTYNTTGNPNGRERHTLQSYIGMLARTMVPINVNSWPDVDADLKDRIWEDIQNTFKVAPESRKLVLTSAGTKWRQFKTTLTNKYVLPYLGRKKKLKKPPKQYNFVGLKPWKEFVSERSTEDWLGAPKQPGGHECGYYVMRYMKEVIDDDSLGFPNKWAAKSRKGYTQDLLDEVRIEVADYMQNLL